MFPYAEERFTDEESEVLRRYVTNLDGPVFALVNLPEVVKGALFARYSRSPKSLRRAEELYERVFFEYGDDSVAQLGGVHLACEQASNVLTKVLEWGRLMAYLEQSTRYIAYDNRLAGGHYRYFRDPDVLDSSLGARYVGDMDRMFDTYGALLPQVQAWVSSQFPQQPGDSDFVYRQSVRAKALDALRGLLPAASLSNVGIYGTGQSYEMLLLRMRLHPLPEARRYGELMLEELRKVIPSFLQRVDIPARGGAWAKYLADTRQQTDEVVGRLWPDRHDHADSGGEAGVRLVDFDPEGEDKVLAAMCYPHMALPDDEVLRRVRGLGAEDRLALARAYVGQRGNRRHRPGRAFERTEYRFDIVSDYGAFRDLQRHRMLTIEWQELGTDLGFEEPAIVAESGVADEYRASLARSAELYDAMCGVCPEQAS